MARQAQHYKGRQRPGIHQWQAADLGRETGNNHPAHPTRSIRRENDPPDRFLFRLKQQNAYIERYNRTVRHEWLDQYIIETIEEAQDHATQWLWTYNNDRPNMGIGGITPAMKLKMAA